jgi:hypothetical protein
MLARVGIEPAQRAAGEPTLLLWGVPVPDSRDGDHLRSRLTTLSTALAEDAESRSEPDVLLDFGQAGVVLIEVKVHSPNEKRAQDHAGWIRYKNTGGTVIWDWEQVLRSELYELTRYWRIGHDLAAGRAFALVNLAPAARFADKEEAEALKSFSKALPNGGRAFRRLTWEDFVKEIPEMPPWLSEYLKERLA